MSVESLQADIDLLRKQLNEKERALAELKVAECKVGDALTNEEISRYSRQIIMPEIGPRGQLKLKAASVLVVGVGGLGCPAALYLAGAGVGRIGLVDYDCVELSNLHRQVLHSEASLGQPKVQSAADSLRRLNGAVRVDCVRTVLDGAGAPAVLAGYDVVLDATDNAPTRYLLSDACVLAGVPLVSGSALQLEGQLTVYGHDGGPCYRCLFPEPPPPGAVTSCGDGGVLGVVPGTIGVLQALEAIKLVLGLPGVLSGRLLVFDAADCSFRSIRLRGRSAGCAACGDQPSVTRLVDYEQFCRSRACDKEESLHLLSDADRISAGALSEMLLGGEKHLLVDVRTPTEFELCHIPGATNLPMKDLGRPACLDALREYIRQHRGDPEFPVLVVCRRGNDSQKAVQELRTSLSDLSVSVRDVAGGLQAWAKAVDPHFPVY
ncbi:adenylyltransferase and sulfurtransferase MOCS3 [Bacillus rossius redtenbacheri]|uniref:adenylyltransferase and sulfurtransferase MOCS3 n=1 Tax=Bacillus rossius redtenbacheri TaxID=93214 RepID=UPI002FDE1668